MAYIELECVVDRADVDRVEEALTDLEPLAVTLSDAADDPVLEPGVGQTPLWPRVVVSALFAADAPAARLIADLTRLVAGLSPERVIARTIADQDWVRAWMDRFTPMHFGQRLHVWPWHWEAEAPPAPAVLIRLDPGLAFGTGTHPTTALCLSWLDRRLTGGEHVVDYGCGSGLLAIAALKLGAGAAVAIDNDPQALLATNENAQRNGVAERLQVRAPSDLLPSAHAQADLLVANILAGPLIALARPMLALLRPGGCFALSGVLSPQAAEVVAAYAPFVSEVDVVESEGWVRIAGRLRS